MLQYGSTVEGKTLDLLTSLMNDSGLSRFNLAGGTSLALQIGHRKSIDLDMFSKEDFNFQELRSYLQSKYPYQERYSGENTIICTMEAIKVDFIAHKYPDIDRPVIVDGIRLYSLADVAAMKLNAITGSGKRIKDFVDIAYLSRKFSLSQMLGFYGTKYGANVFSALKSLFYYDDIDRNETVNLTGKVFDWKQIEKRLYEMQKNQHAIFDEPPAMKIQPTSKLKRLNKQSHSVSSGKRKRLKP